MNLIPVCFLILLLARQTDSKPSSACPINSESLRFQQIEANLQITGDSQTFMKTLNNKFLLTNLNIGSSIVHYDVKSFEYLYFIIEANVKQEIRLNITFLSRSMLWRRARIIVWLTNQPDIHLRFSQQRNLNNSQRRTVVIKSPFEPNYSTVYIASINSAIAISSDLNYQLNCTFSYKTEKQCFFEISTGQTTFLNYTKINIIIYKIQNEQFVVDGGYFDGTLQKDKAVYLTHNRNISSVWNWFLGIHALKIDSQDSSSFNLNMSIDSQLIIEILAGNRVQYIQITYLILSHNSSQICQECRGKYYYMKQNICINTCPAQTFILESLYSNVKGICMRCSSKTNQVLNKQQNICQCQKGYTLSDFTCIQQSQLRMQVNQRILQIGNSNIMESISFQIPENIQEQVMRPSRPKIASMSINNQRKINFYVQYLDNDPKLKAITQKAQTSFNISNIYQQLKQYQICLSNQIYNQQKKKCQCDSFSISYGSTCVRCSLGTYKNVLLNSCLLCIPKCFKCKDNISCQQCFYAHTFNISTGKCQRDFSLKQSALLRLNLSVDLKDNKSIVNQIKCDQTQIIENNRCVCNLRSVVYQNQCLSCPQRTFKDLKYGFCRPCSDVIADCIQCSNQTTCQLCSLNMNFDQKRKRCICQGQSYYTNMNTGLCMKCPKKQLYSKQQNRCVDVADTGLKLKKVELKMLDNYVVRAMVSEGKKCGQNQQLYKQSCICDSKSIIRNDKCQPCQIGTFKYTSFCISCPQNCLQCNSFVDCTRCIDNYVFNAIKLACQPVSICGPNSVKLLSQCICDQFSGRNIKGNCQPCPLGTYKLFQKCLNCSINCQKCISSSICSKCLQGYSFNFINNSCCGKNQIFNSIKAQCQCRNGLYNISGSCGICNKNQTYNQRYKVCIPNSCGNNAVDKGQACDDGNNMRDDGCSELCQQQNGYLCRLSKCMKILTQLTQSTTNSGINLSFKYLFPNISSSKNFIQANLIKGPQDSKIQIIKPPANPQILVVIIKSKEKMPDQGIRLQIVTGSTYGIFRYNYQSKLNKNNNKIKN